MLFRHNMSITQQMIHIYNTTVHMNKSTFPLMWIHVGAMMTNILQGWIKMLTATKILTEFLETL